MIEIIPAILTDSPDKFKELVGKLKFYADRIHIDVADGSLVPNTTVKGHAELKRIKTALKLDIHLMIRRPQDQVSDWFGAGADRFIVHVESDADLSAILDEIKSRGCGAGLAMNPETDIGKVSPFLDKIDFIQFMTVYPGFQGRQFADEVVDKIRAFHQKYPDIIIMADGGVTPETAPALVQAGASILVSGSYILKSEDMGKAIIRIKASTTG